MKSIYFLFFVFSSFLYSQTTFSYNRSWATFYGGMNKIIQVYEKDQKIIVDGLAGYSSNTIPASYYNQFITSGGQPFVPYALPSINNMPGVFSLSGNLLFAEYLPYTTPYASAKFPIWRDDMGNRYEKESYITQYNPLPFNTWLSNNIDSTDIILAKYNDLGVLQWKTYIPNSESYIDIIKTDENGNIYLFGDTKWQNLGDAGTYSPNYTFSYSQGGGSPKSNYFVVKLNPQGQKVWATYIPVYVISDIDVFGGNLYIAGSYDLEPSLTQLSTPGTFQQTKGAQSIIKLDANSGQRIWGTYYGSPGNSLDAGIVNIRVNTSGIYILGITFGTPSTYYATEGAYKAQTVDGFDLYITKFNEAGNRIWGTYIGSDGIEMPTGPNNALDIKDDKILVVGSSTGNYNMATPGAFLDTKPNPNSSDIFFSMFSTAGKHEFTSYYGGTYSPITTVQTASCIFSPTSDSFYLYGYTERQFGYTTPGSHQPNTIYPPNNNGGQTGFLAKFNSENLSVATVENKNDIILFNNPNNGNFTISGSALSKNDCEVSIFDNTGRSIYREKLQKNNSQQFNLQNFLNNGSYIVLIKNKSETLKTFKLLIKK